MGKLWDNGWDEDTFVCTKETTVVWNDLDMHFYNAVCFLVAIYFSQTEERKQSVTEINHISSSNKLVNSSHI